MKTWSCIRDNGDKEYMYVYQFGSFIHIQFSSSIYIWFLWKGKWNALIQGGHEIGFPHAQMMDTLDLFYSRISICTLHVNTLFHQTLVFDWYMMQLVVKRHHAFTVTGLDVCSQNMVTIVCSTFNAIERGHVIMGRRTHCRYDILQLWYLDTEHET